jgi:serine/threonine protein kinase
VHINNFQLIKIVGVGSYGRVWKAIYTKDNKIYAVKEMSKNLIDKLLSRKSVEMERKILGEISGM